MIAAFAFVACFTAVAWAGWRVANQLMVWTTRGASDAADGRARRDLPAFIVAAYIVAAALIVILTGTLGGFGIVPGISLALGPFLIVSALVVGSVELANRAIKPAGGEVLASSETNARAASAPRTATGIEVASPDGISLLPAAVLLLMVVVSIDLALSFGTAPNDWDAMTYHLFLPARWLQEGTIFHVPTVFGDNAGAYAPQNGALLFASSMLLLGSDAATNVMQLSALAAIALATYWLARRLGASSNAAGLGALVPFLLAPLRRQAFSADVDAWMASFFLAGLVMLLSGSGARRQGTMILAGLAAGLVAGTKIVGVTLATPLVAIAAVSAVRRRQPRELIGFFTVALVAGGFWYVRNLVRYGNPLFPLDFAVGPVRFAGAFGLEALQAGQFHLDSIGAVLRNALGSLGISMFLVSAAGAASLVLLLVGDDRAARSSFGHGEADNAAVRRPGARNGAQIVRPRRLAGLLLLISALWCAWFVFVIPHNTQDRFLVPGLLLLVPGCAIVLDIVLRLGSAGKVAVVAMFGALAWSADPIAQWSDRIDALSDAGVAWLPLVLFGLVTTLSCAAVWWLQHKGRAPRMVSAAVLLASVCMMLLARGAVVANENSRFERLARSDFAGWLPDLPFVRDLEESPVAIAYSGANVPYILTGPRFRNRVLYVNAIGAPSDGFYEHWVQGGRRHFATHKPGLYRSESEGPSVWLANLQRAQPDNIVLFALHPFEQLYLPHDARGFPPESGWAAQRPDLFERVLANEWVEVFRYDGAAPTTAGGNALRTSAGRTGADQDGNPAEASTTR